MHHEQQSKAAAAASLVWRPMIEKAADVSQKPIPNPKDYTYNPLGWVEVAQQEGAPIRA